MMVGRHHPTAAVEVWAQDEARIGLVPIVRRVWAPKGQRPVARGRRRYEWMYVYGFVHPSTGRVEWLLLPSVNTELFQLALDFFAEAVGAGEDRRIILVVDQAGWHMTKQLKVPAGIHLFPLPAYSPELQPSERLWPLLREAVANKDPADLDELEKVLVARSRQLRRQPELIHKNTLFDWWAYAAEAERLAA
jgi:hypothetical protein